MAAGATSNLTAVGRRPWEPWRLDSVVKFNSKWRILSIEFRRSQLKNGARKLVSWDSICFNLRRKTKQKKKWKKKKKQLTRKTIFSRVFSWYLLGISLVFPNVLNAAALGNSPWCLRKRNVARRFYASPFLFTSLVHQFTRKPTVQTDIHANPEQDKHSVALGHAN